MFQAGYGPADTGYMLDMCGTNAEPSEGRSIQGQVGRRMSLWNIHKLFFKVNYSAKWSYCEKFTGINFVINQLWRISGTLAPLWVGEWEISILFLDIFLKVSGVRNKQMLSSAGDIWFHVQELFSNAKTEMCKGASKVKRERLNLLTKHFARKSISCQVAYAFSILL